MYNKINDELIKANDEGTDEFNEPKILYNHCQQIACKNCN